MITYINGNYKVELDNNSGDRVITPLNSEVESLVPNFPDSIDLKVSNMCSWGCSFCHENSLPYKSGKKQLLDPIKTWEVINKIPGNIEIAIGGGDILDSNGLDEILRFMELAHNKYLLRITIRDLDLTVPEKYNILKDTILKKYVKWFGISMNNIPTQEIKNRIKTLLDLTRSKCVIHVIAGMSNWLDIISEMEDSYPILILGNKNFGRNKGKEYNLEKAKIDFTIKVIKNKKSINYCFDNLAMQQLDVKKLIKPEIYKQIYQGDEFTHSMYVDAVKQEFAPSSTSKTRVSWSDTDIISYFNKYKNRFII